MLEYPETVCYEPEGEGLGTAKCRLEASCSTYKARAVVLIPFPQTLGEAMIMPNTIDGWSRSML